MADCTEIDGAVIEVEESVSVRKPKRILHFSDGILEEYDDQPEQEQQEGVDKCQQLIDPATLTWLPFLWYYVMTFGSKTLNACDTMGEYLAYFFGITSPKYQYEIEEYLWMKKQEEKEMKEKEDEMKSWKSDNKLDDNDEEFNTIEAQPTNERERY